jgi:hypothetical protein
MCFFDFKLFFVSFNIGLNFLSLELVFVALMCKIALLVFVALHLGFEACFLSFKLSEDSKEGSLIAREANRRCILTAHFGRRSVRFELSNFKFEKREIIAKIPSSLIE